MGLTEYSERRARRSAKTARVYAGAVRLWAKSLGFDAAEEVVAKIKAGELDAVDALDRFVGRLVEMKRAPKTILTYFGAVKGFLEYEDVPLDERRLKARVILPDKYEVSVDRAPTAEEIRRMLLRASLKGKALITLLASSGMRIGEVQMLKVSNIDLSSKPAKVSLMAKATKTRARRLTYISEEASEFLREWLGDRINSPSHYVFPHPQGEDPASKPETIDNLSAIVNRTIEKAGLKFKMDSESARYAIHIHCLRKYFFTQCLAAGVDRGIVEGWMGHKFGLDTAYLRMDEKHLAEQYLKVMPQLTFLSETPVNSEKLSGLTKEVERLNRELEERDHIIEELKSHIPTSQLERLAQNVRDWGYDPKRIIEDAVADDISKGRRKVPLMTVKDMRGRGKEYYAVDIKPSEAVKILQRFLRGQLKRGQPTVKARVVRRIRR